MRGISLSINPTYLCNFRCNFCYLTKEQLADKAKLDLTKLESQITHISEYREIVKVDFYGGELALLPYEYLFELDQVVRKFYRGQVNIITNLSIINPFFLSASNTLSVSWDYHLRQDYKKVLDNIRSVGKDVHILMLASPQMLKWNQKEVDECIDILNKVENIKDVEIKPYSENQANSYAHSYKDFEELVIKWIDSKQKRKFNFTNIDLIKRSLSREAHSWSDDHLYICPQGNLNVLDFDKNQNEYFLELNSFSDYERWCLNEKEKVTNNSYCSSCNYLGHCLSEHLKEVYKLDNSCNGFKGLLDFYAN